MSVFNEFFESDNNIIKKYRIENIAYIPHCYDIKWSIDLNKVLSQLFYCPISIQHGSYFPSKSLNHRFLSEFLPALRKRKDITSVFFGNILEDFTPDVYKAAGIKKVYGILHGSNFIEGETGSDRRLKIFEKAICEMADIVFCPSQTFSRLLPHKTVSVGLPVIDKFEKPRKSNTILFNHRLIKMKQPHMLNDMPKYLRDNVIISSPTIPQFPQYMESIKKIIKKDQLLFPKSHAEYKKILIKSGFGLSLSIRENFATSVMDGIVNGLCYLVLKSDLMGCKDYVIPELMFNSMVELEKKLNFYMSNWKEKQRVVEKQQKNIQKYKVENWIKTLLKYISG